MNVIYLILCVVLLQVQAKKLKICIPRGKKQEIKDFKQAELSLEKIFLMETNDTIYIPVNISTPVVLDGLLSGNVSATNLTISGFHNYSIKLIPIVFTINTLRIKGDNYQLRAAVSDLFDLNGDGKFEIILEQVSMAVTDLFPWWPDCVTVNLKLKLHKWKVNFENFINGHPGLDPVMNVVIGDVGPEVVDYYWPFIYDAMQPIMQKIIDKYINKVGTENHSTLDSIDEIILQNEYVRRSLELLSNLLNAHL